MRQVLNNKLTNHENKRGMKRCNYQILIVLLAFMYACSNPFDGIEKKSEKQTILSEAKAYSEANDGKYFNMKSW